MRDKIFLQYILPALIAAVTSLIVAILTIVANLNKLIKEKRNQIEIEEQVYIEKKILENLNQVAILLPDCYRNEISYEMYEIYFYYLKRRKFAGNEIKLNEIKNDLVTKILSYGDHPHMKQYEIRRLLSICSPELMNEFNKLVNDLSKFEIEQCDVQFKLVQNNPITLAQVKNGEYILLSEEEFGEQMEAFGKRYSALSDNIFAEIRRVGERFNQREKQKSEEKKVRKNWKFSSLKFISKGRDK